ncbi:protein shortage in chiasmata 1 ortholog isoform X2 [Xyrichtys novacula]|uniref:Protein shortage in chiasmata 1 ortholog isoform X2 n=1 Tax=Xyrichtys novacula TaxID=13765 RepID=A0AAV1G7W2_XYRNO|nr:protein shortage in chiasmata 1 ortholog isoform X2 [Xyrichtys novacula]
MAPNGNKDFQLDLSTSFGSPEVHLQRSWPSRDPWEEECRVDREVEFYGWKGRAGAVGRVIERLNDEWTPTKPESPFKLDSMLGYSPFQQPASTSMITYSSVYSGLQHPAICTTSYSMSPPAGVMMWGRSQSSDICSSNSGETTTVSTNYGSKCWLGRERKRSGEVADLPGAGERFSLSLVFYCFEDSLSKTSEPRHPDIHHWFLDPVLRSLAAFFLIQKCGFYTSTLSAHWKSNN